MKEQRKLEHRKTMGELVGRMMVNVLQLQQENESPGEANELWFVFRFTVETDANFFGQLERDMRSLVDVRTALTHQFLPCWYSAVDVDVETALAYRINVERSIQ